MSNSKQIAGLVGPALIAMILTENPYVNPNLYDAQIPPVVYLSGTLMFVAGLAIVRAHNHWRPDWTVVLTIVGWLSLVLGLVRMTLPHAYSENIDPVGPSVIIVEGIILLIGLFLTYNAYFRKSKLP
ncbi:MAG: hypothetical protein MI746_01035 [Pseudomonadales bacterium]|nr:hypothetical protein [Pseudomonadales bacterium]